MKTLKTLQTCVEYQCKEKSAMEVMMAGVDIKRIKDRATGPVSYTHLDVYKRQIINHT